MQISEIFQMNFEVSNVVVKINAKRKNLTRNNLSATQITLKW